MIISDNFENKFQIRNRKDLSVIKTISHKFGWLKCGLCYPEEKVVIIGIGANLIEFDLE